MSKLTAAFDLRPTLLQRYLLKQFFTVLVLCLLAATSVFLVFETFERMKVFLREGSTVVQAVSYLLLKVPFVIHLMTPVAVLVATLISIGRMSQLSEITAMRACGASILWLARPLLFAGALISLFMFGLGETLVPWATERGQEIYLIDIKKKDVKGGLSRNNFWFRDQNTFYNIGYYDSRTSELNGISIFRLDSNFKLRKRLDAAKATWNDNPGVAWTMEDAIETAVQDDGSFAVSRFAKLPLVIKETPRDLYNMKRRPETMSYRDLKNYIETLREDGVAATRYEVDLAAKIAFPLVNLIVILIAFPFALTPARSGNLTMSFVAGLTIGFGYHIVHAISTSLGAAELLPILPSAWTANIVMGCIGGYLLSGAEFN